MISGDGHRKFPGIFLIPYIPQEIAVTAAFCVPETKKDQCGYTALAFHSAF